MAGDCELGGDVCAGAEEWMGEVSARRAEFGDGVGEGETKGGGCGAAEVGEVYGEAAGEDAKGVDVAGFGVDVSGEVWVCDAYFPLADVWVVWLTLFD